jgi:hypothetical protein
MDHHTEKALIVQALAEYATRRRTDARGHRWAGPQHAEHRATLRRQAEEAEGLAGTWAGSPGLLRLPLVFRVGRLEEMAMYLRQEWLSARNEETGTDLALSCGAGLGSGVLEASARRGTASRYAQADIRPLAEALFADLEARLGEAARHRAQVDATLAEDEAARLAVEEATPQ